MGLEDTREIQGQVLWDPHNFLPRGPAAGVHLDQCDSIVELCHMVFEVSL